MKNWTTLFIFCFSFFSWAQIRLNSFPIELKRSSEFHQMINFANENTNIVYSFVADKEKVMGVHFNSALFFSDSISSSKPFNYKSIIGYSFSKNQKPVLHWITEDSKKINSIEYDFSKSAKEFSSRETILSNDKIIASFSHKSFFYVATINKENELKFFNLNTENSNFIFVDNATINITNSNQKQVKLFDIFSQYVPEKMESDFYNPLFSTAQKVKYYIDKNTLIFTFDLNNTSTEVVEINLESFEVFTKKYPFNTSIGPSTATNSYFNNQKLFQIKATKEQLMVTVLDYNTQKELKQFIVSETQNPFRFSSFYVQSENSRIKTIKTSKRFLKKVESGAVGISFFSVEDFYIASLGSVKETVSTAGVALGIGVGITSILAGGDYYDLGAFENTILETAYLDFECTQDFEIQKATDFSLATDYISDFLNQNSNNYLFQTIKYKDYYMLCLYDNKAKEVVLYKFENSF